MTSRVTLSAVLLLAMTMFSGCRQADGPLPVADGDRPNQIIDISRDLASVARGEAQARTDLADDLRVFIDMVPDGVPASTELARRTSEVVAGRTMTDQNFQRLAHQLWTVTSARDLSERQIEAMQKDTQALLVSLGVPESGAQNVVAQVAVVQKIINRRPRRWYELF